MLEYLYVRSMKQWRLEYELRIRTKVASWLWHHGIGVVTTFLGRTIVNICIEALLAWVTKAVTSYWIVITVRSYEAVANGFEVNERVQWCGNAVRGITLFYKTCEAMMSCVVQSRMCVFTIVQSCKGVTHVGEWKCALKHYNCVIFFYT